MMMTPRHCVAAWHHAGTEAITKHGQWPVPDHSDHGSNVQWHCWQFREACQWVVRLRLHGFWTARCSIPCRAVPCLSHVCQSKYWYDELSQWSKRLIPAWTCQTTHRSFSASWGSRRSRKQAGCRSSWRSPPCRTNVLHPCRSCRASLAIRQSTSSIPYGSTHTFSLNDCSTLTNLSQRFWRNLHLLQRCCCIHRNRML